MSRNARRARAAGTPLVAATVTAVVLGCGRGDTNAVKSVGRAGADSAWKASGAQAAIATRATAEEQAALRALPAGPGHDIVLGNCVVCHAATMIAQQHKDMAGWNKTVTQMIAWGAPVPKDQQATLVAYLAEHYPPRAAGAPARQVP